MLNVSLWQLFNFGKEFAVEVNRPTTSRKLTAKNASIFDIPSSVDIISANLKNIYAVKMPRTSISPNGAFTQI